MGIWPFLGSPDGFPGGFCTVPDPSGVFFKLELKSFKGNKKKSKHGGRIPEFPKIPEAPVGVFQETGLGIL